MEILKKRLYYKCVWLCLIGSPAYLWLLATLLHATIGLPSLMYKGVGIVIGIWLVIHTLFLQTCIDVCVLSQQDIRIQKVEKIEKERILQSLMYGLPILICIFFFQFTGLLVYALLQIGYMSVSEYHMSLNDCIYTVLKKSTYKEKVTQSVV